MPLIEVIQPFDHDGTRRKRGEQFRASDHASREFERRGLARVVSRLALSVPREAPGTPPSALPAGPASEQTIAILSEAGEALDQIQPEPRRRRGRKFRHQVEASS